MLDSLKQQPTIEKPLVYVAIYHTWINGNKLSVSCLYERDLETLETKVLEELETHPNKYQSIDIAIVSKTLIGLVKFERGESLV